MDSLLVLAMIQLGVMCVVAQVTLIRGLMNIFSGNELVIGIVMAVWMILTALGSMMGRRLIRFGHKEKLLIAGLTILNILPLVSFYAAPWIRMRILPYGVMAGPEEIMLITVIVLFPFCFLSGMIFILGSIIAHEKGGGNLTGNLYSLESAGSAAGGLLFNAVLVYFLPSFLLLSVLFLVNSLILFPLTKKVFGKKVRISLISTSAILLMFLFSYDWDLRLREQAFINQTVIGYCDTPYGNISVTEQGGQRNYYDNLNWLGSSDDVQTREETVHFVMVQHQKPDSVLVVGGAMTGLLGEVMMYDVKQIDYAEINPWWLKDSSHFHPTMSAQKVRLIRQEPRTFMRESDSRYDVVIMSIPDPVNASLNRFYTIEFMRELKMRLSPDGVVLFTLSSSADYLSDEKSRTHSVIAKTAATCFDHILILPGNKDYLIASENPIRSDITACISEKQISTVFVNSFYMQDDRIAERSRQIHARLDTSAFVNVDFRPLAYYEQIRLWLSSFGYQSWVFLLAMALLIILMAFHASPLSIGLWTAGWTGASIEVLLLITCQILFADVYVMLGILLTVYMAGLAAGSRWMAVKRAIIIPAELIRLLVILGVVSLLCVSVILSLAGSGSGQVLMYAVIMFFLLIVSVLTGMIFTCATLIGREDVPALSSSLYGMDLIGSGIGVLIMTVFVFPIAGMMNAGWILACMNFAAAIIIFVSVKKGKL